MNYKFTMSNGAKGDFLHYHFSADEFYILPILMVATLLQFAILLITFFFAVNLKSRQLFHATYKMFLAVVLLHCIGVTILMCHYFAYAFNGRGMQRAKLLGRVLESGSELLFVLLLILLAKGYTVTRARLRQISSIKLAVFMCSYSVAYASLFIYEQVFFDPGLVLYIYDSVAGYGLVILRFVGWCSLIYSTFFTLKHYPDKSEFYCPFFCFYTLWFVCGPTLIIVANTSIPLWVREKVVVSVEHFVAAMGQLFFLWLTRPNTHNKNFPYHVRTTQIGIMEAMTGNANLGNHTLDSFSHGGNYNVTSGYGSAAAATADIFTVDSVSNRQAPPPPYRPPPPSAAAAIASTISGYPSWSISQPAAAAATTNGTIASSTANGAANGKAKVYDPNEDNLDENDAET